MGRILLTVTFTVHSECDFFEVAPVLHPLPGLPQIRLQDFDVYGESRVGFGGGARQGGGGY